TRKRRADMAVASIEQAPAASLKTGQQVRIAIRTGAYRGPTSGLAPGYVQGNLAILPRDLASDFMRFCQLNPKPCPLLAVGEPGDWRLPTLAEDLDIRTDVPRYRVFQHGELIDEPSDIRNHWRADPAPFALGGWSWCEGARLEDGMELPHTPCGPAVPMYRPSIETAPAGPFHGPLVVSMRPLKPADAIRAVQITTRFPAVHGAP